MSPPPDITFSLLRTPSPWLAVERPQPGAKSQRHLEPHSTHHNVGGRLWNLQRALVASVWDTGARTGGMDSTPTRSAWLCWRDCSVLRPHRCRTTPPRPVPWTPSPAPLRTTQIRRHRHPMTRAAASWWMAMCMAFKGTRTGVKLVTVCRGLSCPFPRGSGSPACTSAPTCWSGVLRRAPRALCAVRRPRPALVVCRASALRCALQRGQSWLPPVASRHRRPAGCAHEACGRLLCLTHPACIATATRCPVGPHWQVHQDHDQYGSGR